MSFHPPKIVRPRLPKLRKTAMRKVAGMNAVREVGDFCVMLRDEKLQIYEIALMFPGSTRASGVIVRKVESIVRTPPIARHIWNWDGDEEYPSLSPDLVSEDSGRDWKGYVLGGQFVQVRS